MSSHPYGYSPAAERPPRRSNKHHYHKSSDSGVGSSSDQDSYTTNPDWNYAVLDSAAAVHADDQLATIASLTEALHLAKARARQAETDAKQRLDTLALKVKQSDAEAAAKERALLERNQEYRDLYSGYQAINARNEVLSDDVKRLEEEKAALAQKNKELEATNEKLELRNKKLERKLASAAVATSSSSEDHDVQSPKKESRDNRENRRKEGKPPSSREHREGRTRTSADPSTPRRSESKRRSTKPKDPIANNIDRANAKATAQAQARGGESEIYEEPWGPSAPRRRRDSSAAAAPPSQHMSLAIKQPRADTTAYSDVSRSSRTSSNGYTRPTDIYVEDATSYAYRTR